MLKGRVRTRPFFFPEPARADRPCQAWDDPRDVRHAQSIGRFVLAMPRLPVVIEDLRRV
jgi:hypothetical protein